MIRILFSFKLLMLLANLGFAQSQIRVDELSTENGLPSNGIKGMQWDENTGFLWIATEAGIARYNGIDLKVFTKENTPNLSERMLFMVRNQSGKLFTADQWGYTFTISKNKLVFLGHLGKDDPLLFKLFLLSTTDRLLQERSIKSRRHYFVPYLKEAVINDTTVYLLAYSRLIKFTLNTERLVNIRGIEEPALQLFKIRNAVFIAGESRILYNVDTDLNRASRMKVKDANGKDFDLRPYLKFIFWQTGMDNPVIIIEDKAFLLLHHKDELRLEEIASEVPTNAYISVVQYSAKRKLLFIGTESKGIFVINEKRIRQIKRDDAGLKERNAYYGQVELNDGRILTNQGHIIGGKSTDPSELPISSFHISAIKTNDSLLWYSAQNPAKERTNLFQYNYSSGKVKVYDKYITSSHLSLVATGGNTYLAREDGIAVIKGDQFNYVYKFPGNIKQIIYTMLEFEKGKLLIATCNGLSLFNTANNKMDTIFQVKGFCVRSIWKFGDYVFFGTYGKGFYIMKDGKVKPMPLDKNKFLLYAHCFIADRMGYVWISTNRGLFKVMLKELVQAFEKDITQVYYHYYGKHDGMEMTEMNGGCTPCAIELKNKTLSFPTMDGLLWVDPEKAIPVLPDGDIFVDQIIVNGKAYNPDDEIFNMSLPASSDEISFELGFPAWANKENIYVDYQLNKGSNWKQVMIEKDATIQFNNLPSGKYTLTIRKLNGFGTGNYSYKVLNFEITTPWFGKWWFYLLAALALYAIFYGYFKYRTSQFIRAQKKLEQQVAEKTSELQEKNAVLEKTGNLKTRLISIISHDIVTPLKFLSVAAKNINEKRTQMPEELQKETLTEIANTSQELQMLSTNILNWIKYQNENRKIAMEFVNLHQMADSVCSVLNSFAKQKNLNLENNIDPTIEVFQYYDPLKILLYNLVSNALNFTERGSVFLESSESADAIFLMVKDDGKGMTAEQISNILSDDYIITSANVDNKKGNGLGYLIIKDLIKMINGRLSITSQKNQGTIVTVQVPRNKTS
jgi:signal transduction histidine kinase